jgi:hypothetical protein
MATDRIVIPESVHNVLKRLTGQSRPDIAVSLALKDLARRRTDDAQSRIARSEKKYGMTLPEFEKACKDGKIPEPPSYEVEKSAWEWEAALTDRAALEEISQWLV